MSNQRILIVEDDQEMAQSLRQHLAEFEVTLVSPGATYCLVLKVGKDSFTVVLPVTSGKSCACQFARKVAP